MSERANGLGRGRRAVVSAVEGVWCRRRRRRLLNCASSALYELVLKELGPPTAEQTGIVNFT